ncbi:MAG: hypothetical protein KBA26_01730 [Candidatus Delongbacteria bacterium]|nr:hypothetical protein [Candidatus Delongbacteria bacterium]
MNAMVWNGIVDLTRERNPLEFRKLPVPVPERDQILILIRVGACGVCTDELDFIE